MKKEIIALGVAIAAQFFGIVWYVSKLDSKVNILYDKFEKEQAQDVVENQVKMKLDLANLIKDCWTWIKEWNEWGMKDWIKAGIICLVVLFIIYKMTTGGTPSA